MLGLRGHWGWVPQRLFLPAAPSVGSHDGDMAPTSKLWHQLTGPFPAFAAL